VLTRFFTELTAAARHLSRAPGFALLAIAMLALGIGANVAIFSIFQSIILRPLPYPDQERLVGFKSLNSAKALTQPALSLTDFRDFKERVHVLRGPRRLPARFHRLRAAGHRPGPAGRRQGHRGILRDLPREATARPRFQRR
jgi:hypothetical protein